MSVGSFIVSGVGVQSTIGLFITEGFGAGNFAPPASAVLGGMVKRRHSKRYEVEINGILFMARSIPALEAKVIQWRKDHPANDKLPPKPVPSTIRSDTGPVRAFEPPEPERREIPARLPSRETVSIVSNVRPSAHELETGAQSLLAAQEMAHRVQEEALQTAIAEALRIAQKEEDDDMEALMAILRVAA